MMKRAKLRQFSRPLLRAAVDEIISHHYVTPGGGVLVPDREGTPRRVVDALTRRFGRARTIDRGEVAYWDVTDAFDVVDDAADAQ